MLIGLDPSTNRILASDARKSESYKCPVCNENVILKQGRIKIHHFAHYPSSSCENVGESYRHIEMKWQIGELAKREGVQITARNFEVPFNGRRADVCIEHPQLGGLVIEVQASPISLQEILERTCVYKSLHGVAWVFDKETRLHKKETDSIAYKYGFVNTLDNSGVLKRHYYTEPEYHTEPDYVPSFPKITGVPQIPHEPRVRYVPRRLIDSEIDLTNLHYFKSIPKCRGWG